MSDRFRNQFVVYPTFKNRRKCGIIPWFVEGNQVRQQAILEMYSWLPADNFLNSLFPKIKFSN